MLANNKKNENMNILEKIKKLISLGNSPEPNEAALALFRAQELMEKYGITKEQISFSNITEKTIDCKKRIKPPLYEARLISSIAQAFGVIEIYKNDEQWLFIGLDHRVQIASYFAEILLRKLDKARREYLKSLKRYKRKNKIILADAFCTGWVWTVVSKIKVFIDSPNNENIINDYFKKKYSTLCAKLEIRNRKISRNHSNAIFEGHLAGESIELQHGIKGIKKQSLIEGREYACKP